MSLRDLALIICLLALFVAGFLFRADGGINLDAVQYARMAEDFPNLHSNVFPAGLPIALFAGKVLCGDFFLASKLVNLLGLLAVFLFSWIRQFFFRETILLFCLKTGVGLWSMSFSEPLFLSLLWFFLYFLHQSIENKSFTRCSALKIASLLLTMTFVRHAGIFLFAGFLVAFPFILRERNKWAMPAGFLWQTGGISLLLFCIYLGISHLIFGSFFGELERGGPDIQTQSDFFQHLSLNARGVLSLANPFFTFVFQHSPPGEKTLFKLLFLLLDLGFLFLAFILVLRKKKQNPAFVTHMVAMVLTYAFLLFGSSIQAGIEIINLRLISPASFLLFFCLLLLYRAEIQRYSLVFMIFALVSLGINGFILMKSPCYYPEIRKKALQLMARKPDARYFFADGKDDSESVYHLPLQGEIRYHHPALDHNHIAGMALGIIRPGLIVLKDTSGKRQSEILFASDLK
jgi:hypothetical protein